MTRNNAPCVLSAYIGGILIAASNSGPDHHINLWLYTTFGEWPLWLIGGIFTVVGFWSLKP